MVVSPILALLAIAASVAASGATPDQLITQVQNRYNNARTLSVDFIESYSLQGHRRPPETGTLRLRKQGKMRWDYTHPEGKLFVSDGKIVYLYTAQDNRVEKVPLKDTEDMRAPLAFLLGQLDLRKEFRDFEVRPGEGGTWLEASAKNERVPYGQIEMLIAPDGEVKQLKVLGRDQSLLEYSFSQEQVNPPLKDAIFHFEIPAGAEVVDAIEFKSEQ